MVKKSENIVDVTGKKICPTQNVQLLISPFGKWEIDAVDESTGTVYIVDSTGTLLCTGIQLEFTNKNHT